MKTFHIIDTSVDTGIVVRAQTEAEALEKWWSFSTEQTIAFRAALAALFDEFPVQPKTKEQNWRKIILERRKTIRSMYSLAIHCSVPTERVNAIYALLK